jgi:hypothetical protein
MSNHNFSNLCEKFSSNVTTKRMRGIRDLKEMEPPCNCNHTSLKVDGTYVYGGECRKCKVVYEMSDKNTGVAYVGKTQWYLKIRTSEQIADVWKVIALGRKKFGPKLVRDRMIRPCRCIFKAIWGRF